MRLYVPTEFDKMRRVMNSNGGYEEHAKLDKAINWLEKALADYDA